MVYSSFYKMPPHIKILVMRAYQGYTGFVVAEGRRLFLVNSEIYDFTDTRCNASLKGPFCDCSDREVIGGMGNEEAPMFYGDPMVRHIIYISFILFLHIALDHLFFLFHMTAMVKRRRQWSTTNLGSRFDLLVVVAFFCFVTFAIVQATETNWCVVWLENKSYRS